SLPVAVGFGVKNAEHARASAAGADGVVVGSVLVEAVRASLVPNGKATERTVSAVTDLIASLAEGVRAGRRQAAEWCLLPSRPLAGRVDASRQRGGGVGGLLFAPSLWEAPHPARCARHPPRPRA